MNGLPWLAACLAAAGCLAAGSASAQSFPCSRASSTVEHAICADRDLGEKDEAVAELYRRARDAHPNDRELVEGQRAWIRERDACPALSRGHDAMMACLNDAYDRRQGDLMPATAGTRTTRPY